MVKKKKLFRSATNYIKEMFDGSTTLRRFLYRVLWVVVVPMCIIIILFEAMASCIEDERANLKELWECFLNGHR